MRILLASAIAALIATPAAADTFIDFTDATPAFSGGGFISDTGVNWAVAWTQDIATQNTAITAAIFSNVPVTSADWYITAAIGEGTTDAAVVASGTYSAPDMPDVATNDLTTMPQTAIASGLDLAAGSYYLVLDGPAGPYINNYNWMGDTATTVTGAGGFTVGSYYSAGSFFGDRPDPVAFAPASSFTALDIPAQFAFRITGDLATPSVPEPASWAMMIAGFGLVGGAMRISLRRATLAD